VGENAEAPRRRWWRIKWFQAVHPGKRCLICTAIIALPWHLPTGRVPWQHITIRNLDDDCEARLRVRAARRSSMEEGGARISCGRLSPAQRPEEPLVSIHARFAAVGGLDLPPQAQRDAATAGLRVDPMILLRHQLVISELMRSRSWRGRAGLVWASMTHLNCFIQPSPRSGTAHRRCNPGPRASDATGCHWRSTR